jgi:O-antigen/teichoic acid export membrane protein
LKQIENTTENLTLLQNTTDSSIAATALPHSKTFSRLLKGMGSTALSQIIAAGQSLFLVPLYLYAWGTNGYGQWIALTSLISYLALLDLGGQSYIGNLLAIEYARGELQAFQKKLSEGVSLFLGIALAILGLLILGLFGLLPLFTAISGNPTPSIENRLIILFASIPILMAIPGGIYVSAYRASGLFSRGTMVGNILRGLELISYTLLLFFQVTPVFFALGLTIAATLRTVFVVRDTFKYVPACRNIKLSLKEAKNGLIYLKGSLQFWMLSIASAINQQGVLLVLSITSTSNIVALYATHRTAAGLINYVGTLVQAPLWPEFSHLWATARHKEMQSVALLAPRIILMLSGLAAIFLWLLLPWIYPLWTGKHLQLQPLLFTVFLIQVVLYAGWYTTGWSLLAANQHYLLAIASLANALLTIVLALVLAPRFGAVGVAIASLLGDVVCGLFVFPFLASRFLKVKAKQLYWSICLVIITLLPMVLGMAYIRLALTGWQQVVSYLLLILVWIGPSAYLVLGRIGIEKLQNQLRQLIIKLKQTLRGKTTQRG